MVSREKKVERSVAVKESTREAMLPICFVKRERSGVEWAEKKIFEFWCVPRLKFAWCHVR